MFPQEILKLQGWWPSTSMSETLQWLGDIDQGGKGQGQVGIPRPDGRTQDSQDPEMLVASQNQPFKVTLRIGPMCKMRG